MLRRVRQSLRQVLFLMARRPDLLCGAIVLSVLLILAVKFTCSRAKDVVAPARPPVRFFSAEAPVVDLYLGQLDQVERLKSVAEVSLVFFYAPWCAHSMAARQEVQQVAKKLAKQVQFVAVNCWYSQGKCRRQNRFYHYPIIHLFYRRFGPIEYKGPFVAPYVESFVLRVITPLTYLPSRDTLKEFLSYHESGVVGFFQFNSSPQPPGYVTYLSSALQALKRDFYGVVRFGVVTNKQVAEALSLNEDESVYLHRRFNSSLIFPRLERNFTSESISSWVFEHRESVLHWLQPPGTKSRLLEQELTKGPALLLFLPHNPLQSNPILHQIADVALRYHSCENNNNNDDDRSGADRRFMSRCCQSLLLPRSGSNVCEVCLGSNVSGAPVRCSFLSAFHTRVRHRCLQQLPAPASMETASSSSSSGCSSFLSSYSPFSHFSACCRRREPMLGDFRAKEEAKDAPPSPPTPPSSLSITGLRCQTNRTLRFYLLDVELNWPLAVRLGATGKRTSSLHREAGGSAGNSSSSSSSSDRSFAAIVNLKDEVHYVLHRNSAITLTESLEAFIMNFSAPYSLLERHLVGEEEQSGGGEEEEEERRQTWPRPLIAELTTSSFLPSIMDLQKDVLLFYYTQWCGFCSVLNHIIIQLARLLQGNSTITVARVNVARNDLPWEFMVDHVPSILLFPKYRKHFSVKFPDDLPITLPNLLHFLLKHSGSEKPATSSPEAADASGPRSALRAEVVALQRELQALHQARERLSQQLSQLWRDNRRLAFDARGLEAQNAALQRERHSLEERHREKSRQLGDAVRRLQELADASEHLLNENMLLRILLRALKDRTEAERREQERKRRSHVAS